MKFIDEIISQAKQRFKTIVLPEGKDSRIVEAAIEIKNKEIAKVIVLVNESDENEGIARLRRENVEVIVLEKSNKLREYSDLLFELRKSKGMTRIEAEKLVLDTVHFGALMVKSNDADGMVAGAIHSTGDVLRPALQLIKTAPNVKVVSSFFIMDIPKHSNINAGLFAFSDCGLIENPTCEQLSEIAVETARSYDILTGNEPRVALLSYSTMGSAKSELVDKVINAKNIVQSRYPNLKVDGELQLDAAIVPEVAKLKAPSSNVAGYANVLIFPDLQAGNIGYKLVERFANANAYGPITQGLNKPVNDLSRGCNYKDVIAVVAITALQCK